MTQAQLLQVILQLKNATAILEGDAPVATKINTLETIGSICSYQGRKWGDEEFYKIVDSINQTTV
jgi:hypothetical protein